jgi:hypothetical protein
MKIQEKFIYEIWKEKKLSRDLITSDDQKIEVIDPGLENKDLAGPDFLSARIKIGNITYLGDVEIDPCHSDWKAHGHYFDKKYNKVILHLVISNDKHQPYVFTNEGRKVNSLCLTDCLDENLQTLLNKSIQDEKKNRIFTMPCSERNTVVPFKDKINFISELGVERFKNKSRRILDRIKQMIYLKEMNIKEPVLKYDFGPNFNNKKYTSDEFNDEIIWQQLIQEMIFEALGYSKNKEMMIKLAKAVNFEFINRFAEKENLSEIIESSLLNVSGILPVKHSYKDEETSEYVRKMVELWNEIKDSYDGSSSNKEQWNFFKLRPQNFPTIRIAGGSRLLSRLIKENLFSELVQLFKTDKSIKEYTSALRNMVIVKGEGYWATHYVFDKKSKEDLHYFVGLSRADELIINVLLPIVFLYFEIFSDTEASMRVKNLYVNYYQKSSNQLVDQVSETLELKKASQRSVTYQGLIELFRNYCVKERCLECKIGEKIFN